MLKGSKPSSDPTDSFLHFPIASLSAESAWTERHDLKISNVSLMLQTFEKKVTVTFLGLGGFREGTLNKLKYYHIKDDFERGISPLHIHVEAHITKGKYADYDTFISHEGINYLKAYLKMRQRGSPRGHIPPETLHVNSPLIRNARSTILKAITSSQIYRIVNALFVKAGIRARVNEDASTTFDPTASANSSERNSSLSGSIAIISNT
jgi:hypothetical protein